MTLSKMLAALREFHGRPDLNVQLTWDGADRWTAAVPGYIVIDMALKSVTSSMAIGKTPFDALTSMVAQLRGRVLQIQNSAQKPYPVPPQLELGTIAFGP